MSRAIGLRIEVIQGIVSSCLTEAGVSTRQADAVARSISACERDDCKSHGIFRLPGYLKSALSGKMALNAEPKIRKLAPAVVQIDAANGFAPLAHEVGFEPVTTAAKNFGLAAMPIVNCLHFTALWTELEPIAEAGLAAFAFRNGLSRVAQHGGRTPLFGTNPMAFAWPRRGARPYIFDFATSEIARGEIQMRQRRGETMPLGWAVDPDGRPTSDPTTGLRGAQLTFGGHKGSALATMIELLSGPLIGDMLSTAALKADNGDGGPPRGGELVIVLDPASFSDVDGGATASDQAESLFARLSADPGARLAGDRRYAARARNLADGARVPVDLLNDVASLSGQRTKRLIESALSGANAA